MRLRTLLVLLVVAGALAAPAAALADPPTLTGETFTGTFSESVGNCDTLPNPTIHYHVSGIAAGLYPGTFNETGTVVISAPGTLGSRLVDLDARFTIDSPAGQVAGEKHFVASSSGDGICQLVGPGIARRKFAEAKGLSYRAVIRTAPGLFGLFVDCGSSDLLFQQNTTPDMTTTFSEGFMSSRKSPVPFWTLLFGARPCG
jgi:hypothetical protein